MTVLLNKTYLHIYYFFQSYEIVLFFFQIWITCVGFGLGLTIYGPIAIFGVVAMETAPNNLAGTAHAIACLFANGKPEFCIYTPTNCRTVFVRGILFWYCPSVLLSATHQILKWDPWNLMNMYTLEKIGYTFLGFLIRPLIAGLCPLKFSLKKFIVTTLRPFERFSWN